MRTEREREARERERRRVWCFMVVSIDQLTCSKRPTTTLHATTFNCCLAVIPVRLRAKTL